MSRVAPRLDSPPGMLAAFEAALAARGFMADDTQRAAARRLQQFHDEVLAFQTARGRLMGRLFKRTPVPRGVYFWGGVGRGKSFLMDCFFDAIPFERKRRVHFHAFMREVHERLRALKSEPDPLMRLADEIAAHTTLLCFDEFHVSDIADAMILGRLLEALFARQVMFCMTSNYPPDGLYPNGLQRHNFLPTIALLNTQLDVLEVDSGVDYRLRRLTTVEVYHVPDDEAAEQRMADYFAGLAGTSGVAGEINVLSRSIPVKRYAPGVVWFDFDALCDGPRSQNDYLEIAREYHTVLLSHVPLMSAAQASIARRFTWLVDVLYDQRVKLIVTAQAPAHALYTQGQNAHEFARTVSRLVEMRSRDYLAEPHRPDISIDVP